MSAPAVDAPAVRDGSRDFDFLHGTWNARQRKIANILDKDCTEWVEFDSVAECRPVLNGLGNVDVVKVDALPPSGEAFEGLTVRLYDPATDLWRVWWVSSRAPGMLEVPVVGRFEDGECKLYADEVVGGHLVRVRYHWTVQDDAHARWQQHFSYDSGQTWVNNWVADFTRI